MLRLWLNKLEVHKTGGWIRAGLAPYNTDEEVELLIEAVKAFVLHSKKIATVIQS